jgi:hypothetical protein
MLKESEVNAIFFHFFFFFFGLNRTNLGKAKLLYLEVGVMLITRAVVFF